MIGELLDDVLEKEGGYVDHPNDRGGPTNYGITQATLSSYLGRAATRRDVRGLSVNTAKSIYRKIYYSAPRIDELPKPIQPIMFDMAVNHGPRNASKILQRILNATELVSVISDGVVGTKTIRACETVYDAMGMLLVNALVDERVNFYHNIVEKDNTQCVFLTGWLSRAEYFRKDVVV